MLSTIGKLQATYINLINEVAIRFIPDAPKPPIAFAGKLGDPNMQIIVPSIYISRGNASIDYLAIDHMADVRFTDMSRLHKARLTVPILIEIIAGNYGSCEIITDVISRIVLATRKYVEQEFKVHFTGPPVISAPEIFNQDNKVWKSFIQFPVMKEIAFKEGRKGMPIEDIIINILKKGEE